ncbi:MAG: hypothetical protein LUI05_08060 [Oscillospiraceae bacterium]|nr:hypothetical protein [Oscillospiraceae bacterium]
MEGVVKSAEAAAAECNSLNANGGCSLLGLEKCKGTSCRYIYSSEEEKNESVKWRKRLSSLSPDEQRRISKKYYGGSMPWRE